MFTWLTGNAVKYSIILVLVVGTLLGAWYLIYNSGKKAEAAFWLPKLAETATEFTEFKNLMHNNALEAGSRFAVLDTMYDERLTDLEEDYKNEIEKLKHTLDSYKRQRLRDKDSLQTASDRISSLSDTASRFAGASARAGELSEKLERLEAGILSTLVDPAERQNAKLRVCQQYIGVLKVLKDKYDNLRSTIEIEPES